MAGIMQELCGEKRKFLHVNVFLIHSLAASERVFSLLNAFFSDQQQSSLQDYVETSIMLQYNEH